MNLDPLTATEARVAGLAAGGRSDGEIATELTLEPQALELHLAQIYRKLGVHSRTELTLLLRPPAASLYERLGGVDAIAAVVDSFVARCAGDERINGKFARTDVARLKSMLVDQVGEAAGGPCTYSGRDMRETHRGMGVTAGEFDALVEDLVATLDEFDVPRAEQDELLGLLAPMRPEIVEVESPRTGTPLPADYQTAPSAR